MSITKPNLLRQRSRKLNRRDVLRGVGTIAVGLPWLEAMGTIAPASAQTTTTAKRFVAVYQPGGTVLDRWKPSEQDGQLQLSSILAPFEAVRDKLLVVEGMNMSSAIGEQHQAGIVALLTGTAQGRAGQYARGPSLDQVISTLASAGQPRSSLEVAVRWATGKSHGLLHPINSLNFADDANFSPIPPRVDPVEIYEALFGSAESSDEGTAVQLQRKQSVLDFLDRRYETVSAQLGSDDRQKLQEHLSKIRTLENSLSSLIEQQQTVSCQAPELTDTSGYNPASGLSSSDDGSLKDNTSDALIPTVGKLMMDMLVMALACDTTSVVTLQWSDTEAKHTFPWLELSEHHHYYQHDGGFRANECERIGVWYSEQHAYLLQQMAQVTIEDHTLLDESVVFFGSELQDPPTHAKNNMPFLLAGNGGGLRTGRRVQYDGRSHNDLLVSILNLFGDSRQSFGDADHSMGPLSDLV